MFNAIYFPLGIVADASHSCNMLYLILLTSVYTSISFQASSLSSCLVRSVLFSFHVLNDVSVVFLLLISSLVPLWSKNILCVIIILLNLLKFVLLSRMWYLGEYSTGA